MSFDIADPLASLGWDAGFARDVQPFAADGLVPARVIAHHKSGYLVAGAFGERPAVAAGRLLHAAVSAEQRPAVGDWVAALVPGDGAAVIRAVLPRRGAFVRRAAGTVQTEAQVVAANVDVALIATALPADLNPRRLERYLAVAWESGALPVILLTKADLAPDVPAAIAAAQAAAPGAEVVAVSSVTGAGFDELARHLAPGRTAVLLGSSGVGKSTLVNRLLGREALKTGAVRDDGRGRHTTTHRELVRLASGALLIDTPGMREMRLWTDGDGEGLSAAFADLEELAAECRFRDCRHEREPGCAVRRAVDEGRLHPERLESWRSLGRELAFLEAKQDQRLRVERDAAGRIGAKAARAHIRRKYGG